ncbi:MAG: ribokinase [Blautia sp.]|nr:ribokinase [Blautia sp.]
MKVLNFGSLNVDNVYSMPHFVTAGETLASSKIEKFCGGKGLNQSVALAKAGLQVYHAGAVGNDGDMLLDVCHEYGVDTTYIKKMDGPGGHTVIQVDETGQNCIILYGGTNRLITPPFVDEVIAGFGEGDILVLQNEISSLPYIIDKAYAAGMKIVLNPSPYDSNLDGCDFSKIWLFLLNEVEGLQCTGCSEPQQIMDELMKKYPGSCVVLTLGSAGAWYCDKSARVFQDIFKVKAVDTTAAGDTFTGFFVASLTSGESPAESLRIAAKASSIAVTRKGAAPSVPTIEEVKSQL